MKVYKYDTEGYFIGDVFLNEFDEIPDNCTDMFLPDGMHKARFTGVAWVEDLPQEEIDRRMGLDLDTLKVNKDIELNMACKEAILGRFSAQVDGLTYYFSNDSEAQSNFKDAKSAFDDGTADIYMGGIVPWTAYDENENVVRLQLNREQFMPINIARMMHQQNNVGKYRDELMQLVKMATTPEEVEAIKW